MAVLDRPSVVRVVTLTDSAGAPMVGRLLEDRDGLLFVMPSEPVGSRVARGDLSADRRRHA